MNILDKFALSWLVRRNILVQSEDNLQERCDDLLAESLTLSAQKSKIENNARYLASVMADISETEPYVIDETDFGDEECPICKAMIAAAGAVLRNIDSDQPVHKEVSALRFQVIAQEQLTENMRSVIRAMHVRPMPTLDDDKRLEGELIGSTGLPT